MNAPSHSIDFRGAKLSLCSGDARRARGEAQVMIKALGRSLGQLAMIAEGGADGVEIEATLYCLAYIADLADQLLMVANSAANDCNDTALRHLHNLVHRADESRFTEAHAFLNSVGGRAL